MKYCPACAAPLILKPCADEGECHFARTAKSFILTFFPYVY